MNAWSLDSETRHARRASFEEVAELYDQARPSYPDPVFEDLIELARLTEGARILEIGPGTGIATEPLAARGFDVVAVELGKELAEVARRRLAAFSNVEVLNATFEEWSPDRGNFDAVVAFTAFHWIDPDVRYSKSVGLLAPGGALGVVETQHVLLPDGDDFWTEVQADYDAIIPSPENKPPPHPDDVRDLASDFATAGLKSIQVRRHIWDLIYGADSYVAVLATYSANRRLAPATRERLFERIRNRIKARPDQAVRKTYLATLTVGRRAENRR